MPTSYDSLKVLCQGPDAVLFSGGTGDWFRTTAVRQGCLLSPILANVFVERIVNDAIGDYGSSVSIGGMLIRNFRYENDIVVIAEEGEESDVGIISL